MAHLERLSRWIFFGAGIFLVAGCIGSPPVLTSPGCVESENVQSITLIKDEGDSDIAFSNNENLTLHPEAGRTKRVLAEAELKNPVRAASVRGVCLAIRDVDFASRPIIARAELLMAPDESSTRYAQPIAEATCELVRSGLFNQAKRRVFVKGQQDTSFKSTGEAKSRIFAQVIRDLQSDPSVGRAGVQSARIKLACPDLVVSDG